MLTTLILATPRLNQQEVPLQTHMDKLTSLKDEMLYPVVSSQSLRDTMLGGLATASNPRNIKIKTEVRHSWMPAWLMSRSSWDALQDLDHGQYLGVIGINVALSCGLFNFGMKILNDDHTHLSKMTHMGKDVFEPSDVTFENTTKSPLDKLLSIGRMNIARLYGNIRSLSTIGLGNSWRHLKQVTLPS